MSDTTSSVASGSSNSVNLDKSKNKNETLEQELWKEREDKIGELGILRRFWRRLWLLRFLMTDRELIKNAEYENVDRRVVRRLMTRGNLLGLALRIEKQRTEPSAELGLVLGARDLRDERTEAQKGKKPEKIDAPQPQEGSPQTKQEDQPPPTAQNSSPPPTAQNSSPPPTAQNSSPPPTAQNSSSNSLFGYSQEEVEVITSAARYRIATTDLFVEKAQYYLEIRALLYLIFALVLFSVSILSILFGAVVALRNTDHPPTWPKFVFQASSEKPGRNASNQSGDLTKDQVVTQSALGSSNDQGKIDGTDQSLAATGDGQGQQGSQIAAEGPWINLLRSFIRSFTAYGFLVLLAVIAARAAKACMDQREQLLTRRHSLRQGRLFLHLNGGLASVEELKVAFDWNHSQPNAFSHFDPEAKAPWGSVIEEIVKIIPEVAKATANATIERSRPSSRG